MRQSVVISVFAVLSCLVGVSASAHPMGNYSTNQYFLVDTRGDQLTVYYLLDMAEIPAFKELDSLDADMDEVYTDAEQQAYLDKRLPEILAGLHFSANGMEHPLSMLGHRLSLIPGLGGMTVINLLVKVTPVDLPWPPQLPATFEVESTLYNEALGVRECKVITDGVYNDTTRYLGDVLKYQQLAQWDENGNGFYQDYDAQFLIRLEAPETPTEIATPTKLAFDWTYTARAAVDSGEADILEGLAAAVNLKDNAIGTLTTDDVEGTVATDGERTGGISGNQAAWVTRLSSIVQSREISLPVFLVGLLIAAAMGAGHALSPGHGKTVMAAYLIGERGTYIHAAVLGIVVTITHTWSIVLFGTGILYAGQHIVPETVEFWSGILSGAIIFAIGMLLFAQRYRTFALATATGHHGAMETHGHSHEPPVVIRKGSGYTSILWLGVSGGIVPCPAALIVLLLAIKADRLGYGLALILAFSAGLAVVLVAIGIALVRTGGAVRKRMGEKHPLLLVLPVFSAVLITLLGGWVVIWTLIQFNVLVVMPQA